jgi:REP element-mobilizing transposase RayT
MVWRVARKVRIEYPGAVYQLMNRGDRREAIFRNDADRELFLATLGEACQKTDWQVQAYCLMGNHFHLVVETPRGNLVAGMQWFLGTYTGRFNRRHRLSGHLFGGRYKALVVDAESPGYLRTACEYVHLNPVRAKLLRPEEPLRAYRWSSYPAYLERPGRRPAWLRVERLLGELGIPKDSAAGRQRLERLMEERRGASHYGEELRESATEKAERLAREGLRKRGWTEAELAKRPKGDGAKLELAVQLPRETTMPLKWIAERLRMGTGASLSNLLSERRRKGK